MCAVEWAQKNSWEVLDHLVSAAQRERIPGAWADMWSPTFLLRHHGFEDLLRANSVLAAGPNMQYCDGSMSVVVELPRVHVLQGQEEGLRQEAVIRIPEGMSRFARLSQDVQLELSKVGNH